MNKVHYIGFYIGNQEEETYTGNIPGKLKMRYIAENLCKTNHTVAVYSLANKKDAKLFYAEQKIKYNDQFSIQYSAGCLIKGRLSKVFNAWIKKIGFILYFIFGVKKDETIVLYHSVPYTKAASRLKKIFKRKVISEVEEIYGYAAGGDQAWVDKEIEYIKAMDAYIVVNDGIPEKVCGDKNYVVSYGVTNIPQRKTERFDDGKIHVVYAGTIETRKLGAITAIETAAYLPENYHMHILGFGEEESIENAKKKINEINAKLGDERVSYEGYKTGDELDQFLFHCHIGLSSNVMRANFANNSFPSKVITYMAHDLAIVLGYASALAIPDVAKTWAFFTEYKPEKIADAIKAVTPISKEYYHPLLKKLDDNLLQFFSEEL